MPNTELMQKDRMERRHKLTGVNISDDTEKKMTELSKTLGFDEEGGEGFADVIRYAVHELWKQTLSF